MEFASHIEKNVCTTSADRTIAMYSVLNLVGQYTRWNLTKHNGIQESWDTIFDSKLFINVTFEFVQFKQTLFPNGTVRFYNNLININNLINMKTKLSKNSMLPAIDHANKKI